MQSQFCVPCLLCGNGNTYALTAAVIVICACSIYTGPETAGYESVFLWAADVRVRSSCFAADLANKRFISFLQNSILLEKNPEKRMPNR
jgi:hypothetical protein